MYEHPRRRSAWPAVIILFLSLLFVGMATWWLESRFGSGVALMILGGLVGVLCVIVGYLLSMSSTRSTLANAAQFNAELASVERARTQTSKAEIGVYREYARSEREAFAQRAKLDALDVRNVQRLAQQYAKQLTAGDDVPDGWDVPDVELDSGPGGFQFYE